MPKFGCVASVGAVVVNAFLLLQLYWNISSHPTSIAQIRYQSLSHNLTTNQQQQHKTILQDYNDTLLQEVWNKVPVLEAPHLPRLLSPFHQKTSLRLLDEITKFFDEHNIEYVMCFGTLLGSYVAHSVLAWDDDIDIVIHARHQPLLEKLINDGLLKDIGINHMIACFKKNEKNASICDRPKNKFWFKDSHWKTHQAWLNPFVDVILYDSNVTHVWLLNWMHLLVLPIETFYPLQRRPLNGRWLYAPREPYAFLVANYLIWADSMGWKSANHTLTCNWPDYNHWTERFFAHKRKADCETLLAFYPFVRRSKIKSGGTVEDLILDNVTYYSIVTSETFLKKWQPRLHILKWFEYWPRVIVKLQ